MSEIVASVDINAPPAEVFTFATTPDNWPKFWSVTLGVEGDTHGSPPVGAKWTEHVKVGLWVGDFFWHTAATSPPHTFEMRCWSEGTTWLSRLAGRSTGDIKYFMKAHNGGTHFRRVMTYTEPNWFLRLLDALIFRHIMRNAIHKALAKLKTILESTPQPRSAA